MAVLQKSSEQGPGRRGALLSSLLTFADFGANSLTTLVLAFMGAHALPLSSFGAFGAATNIALFAQAIAQGGLIDVMMRDGRSLKPDGLWTAERLYPIALIVGVISLIIGQMITPWLFFMTGACIIYLYVRTFWIRAYLVANDRAAQSGALSLASLGLAAIALVLTLTTGLSGWLAVLGAHLLCYGVPTALVHLRLRQFVSSAKTTYWNLTYAIENLILMGALQLSSVAATPFLGLSFSAGLRGASIIFGPLSVLFAGTRLLLLPWLAGHRRSMRYPWAAASVMAAVCALWGLAAFFVVRYFGPALLGETAAAAEAYLPWVAATYITQGAYMVLFVAGRAYLADAAVRTGRSVEVLIVVLGTLAAVWLRSATAYFIGNTLSMIVAFVVLSWLMRSHLSRPRRALEED